MNFIQFITTKQFLKHFALSLLITLLATWITLSLLKRYTKHGVTLSVPAFIGLSIFDVSKMESASSFDLVVVDSVYDYTRVGGIIVSQDPKPDSKVKPGRKIYLSVVAFLPEQVKMPSLVDLSLRQAKALLQTYNLKLGFIKSIPDPAKNAVLQCSHKGRILQPGSMLAKGSVIDLYIGSGTPGNETLIPFLIGKSRTEALSDIVRLGLMLGEEVFPDNFDTLDARVYSQDPVYVYGAKIPVLTTVNLSYRAGKSFDFESYIESLQIDTVYSDSIPK